MKSEKAKDREDQGVYLDPNYKVTLDRKMDE
jgi:hypothetical protein